MKQLVLREVNNDDCLLKLNDIFVNVCCYGYLSETTVVMEWENPFEIVVEESELEFPLAEGATVSGFGMDVDGVLVDGVIVSKEKARTVFESEVRKKKTVSIVEQAVGNVFRNRVSKIEPGEKKKIKISFTQDLLSKNENGRKIMEYRLPLSIPNVFNFNLEVFIYTTNIGLPSIHFGTFSDRFSFEKSFEKNSEISWSCVTNELHQISVISQKLQILIPFNDIFSESNSIMVGRKTDSLYFHISDTMKPAKYGDLDKIEFNHVIIFWDCSLSRKDNSYKNSLILLKKFWENNSRRSLNITLVPFNVVLQKKHSWNTSTDDVQRLLDRISNMRYYGGTNFKILESQVEYIDYALLFMDGIVSFGNRELPTFKYPVYVFNEDEIFDSITLKKIAFQSGGDYYNIQNEVSHSIINSIGAQKIGIKKLEVYCNEDFVQADVYPNLPFISADKFKISGKIDGELYGNITIKVYFGAIGTDKSSAMVYTFKNHSKSIIIEKGNLVSRCWGQAKLEQFQLTGEDENLDEEILSIGREFNFVTPNSSLIVLESLSQYLQYEIPPPMSLPDMYSKYFEIINSQIKEKKHLEYEKINRVKNWWLRRTDWYSREFTKINLDGGYSHNLHFLKYTESEQVISFKEFNREFHDSDVTSLSFPIAHDYFDDSEFESQTVSEDSEFEISQEEIERRLYSESDKYDPLEKIAEKAQSEKEISLGVSFDQIGTDLFCSDSTIDIFEIMKEESNSDEMGFSFFDDLFSSDHTSQPDLFNTFIDTQCIEEMDSDEGMGFSFFDDASDGLMGSDSFRSEIYSDKFMVEESDSDGDIKSVLHDSTIDEITPSSISTRHSYKQDIGELNSPFRESEYSVQVENIFLEQQTSNFRSFQAQELSPLGGDSFPMEEKSRQSSRALPENSNSYFSIAKNALSSMKLGQDVGTFKLENLMEETRVNFDKTMDRGQSLDDLVAKSSELSSQSELFVRKSKKMSGGVLSSLFGKKKRQKLSLKTDSIPKKPMPMRSGGKRDRKPQTTISFGGVKFSNSYKATIGADFSFKTIDVDGSSVGFQFWDTAGQERFRALSKSFFRGTNMVIFMYDISNRNSFNEIPYWMTEFNVLENSCPKFLIGTKLDLDKRMVSENEAESFANRNQLIFHEISNIPNYDDYLTVGIAVEDIFESGFRYLLDTTGYTLAERNLQKVVALGESGVGKTTFLKILENCTLPPNFFKSIDLSGNQLSYHQNEPYNNNIEPRINNHPRIWNFMAFMLGLVILYYFIFSGWAIMIGLATGITFFFYVLKADKTCDINTSILENMNTPQLVSQDHKKSYITPLRPISFEDVSPSQEYCYQGKEYQATEYWGSIVSTLSDLSKLKQEKMDEIYQTSIISNASPSFIEFSSSKNPRDIMITLIYDSQENLFDDSQLEKYYKNSSKHFNSKNEVKGLESISNLCELHPDNISLLRSTAFKLEELKFGSYAHYIYQLISQIRATEPQSLRDWALSVSKKGDHFGALQILNSIVIKEWDPRFNQIELVCMLDAVGIVTKINPLRQNEVPPIFKDLFSLRISLDLRVVCTWDTNEAHVELLTYEPNGECCNSFNNTTTNGGFQSRDFNSYGPVEYLIKKGTKGDYKFAVKLKYPGVQSRLGKVNVKLVIQTNFGLSSQKDYIITKLLPRGMLNEEIHFSTVTMF